MKFLKSNKFYWICLAVGIALLIAAVIMPFVQMQMHVATSGPVVIIGGADMPTLHYMLSGIPAYLSLPGILLILVSVVCLVVKKAKSVRNPS